MTILASEKGGRGTPRSIRGGSSDPLHVPGVVRVLIVEDDWPIATEIEAALLDAGYVVAGVAASAEEAIRQAEQSKPHVATMDVRLRGELDGVSAARELYRLFGLRCLFVSAYVDEPAKLRAAEASPLGWLQKPFVSADIVLAMRAALRRLERE